PDRRGRLLDGKPPVPPLLRGGSVVHRLPAGLPLRLGVLRPARGPQLGRSRAGTGRGLAGGPRRVAVDLGPSPPRDARRLGPAGADAQVTPAAVRETKRERPRISPGAAQARIPTDQNQIILF